MSHSTQTQDRRTVIELTVQIVADPGELQNAEMLLTYTAFIPEPCKLGEERINLAAAQAAGVDLSTTLTHILQGMAARGLLKLHELQVETERKKLKSQYTTNPHIN